jgi:hypothetical protein
MIVDRRWLRRQHLDPEGKTKMLQEIFVLHGHIEEAKSVVSPVWVSVF